LSGARGTTSKREKPRRAQRTQAKEEPTAQNLEKRRVPSARVGKNLSDSKTKKNVRLLKKNRIKSSERNKTYWIFGSGEFRW